MKMATIFINFASFICKLNRHNEDICSERRRAQFPQLQVNAKVTKNKIIIFA